MPRKNFASTSTSDRITNNLISLNFLRNSFYPMGTIITDKLFIAEEQQIPFIHSFKSRSKISHKSWLTQCKP